MNEEEMKELIRQYGDAMPGLPDRPRRSKAVRRSTRLLLPLTAVIAGALVFVAAMPSAEARAMGELRQALQDVRTLHARTWVRNGNGPDRFAGETWMKNGIWCFESRMGSPLHSSWIIKGDQQYMNDLVRHVTTVEPKVGAFSVAKTALGFVIEQTDTGPMGIDRKMTRTEGPVTDGRATYVLTFFKARAEEPNENSRAVILVDAKTNLPIRSETTTHLTGSQTSVERSEYEFDQPVADAAIEPRYRPILDLEKRQNQLVAGWRRNPLAETADAAILDAQMNEEGALFLLFRGKSVPNRVVAEDGTVYLAAMDYRPGGAWGDTGTQKRCGDVRGTVFVPATLHAPATPAFEVGVGARSFQYPGSSNRVPAPKGAKEGTVRLRAQPCEVWPDYQYELMLAHFFANIAPRMASTQAAYLEKAGDVDGAVARYRLAFDGMRNFIPSIAYREIVPAERLLRSKGRTREADALAIEIAKYRAVDPNLPENEKP